MLKLNVNQEKQMTFEVQLGGVQSDQIQSYLRIEIDEIEYGFPAKVGRESISVDLPPLKTITARRLKEGEKAEVKLEIIADGNLLIPWKDTFSISNPLVVEARIVEDVDEKPTFKTKLVTEVNHVEQNDEEIEEEEVPSKTEEELLTEKIIKKLAKKLAKNKLKEQEDKLNEDEAEDIENDEIEGDEEVDESCGKPHKKGVTTEDLLNTTEADVYAYMERAGSKNTQVQKIVYEQAEKAAKSSKPLYVLKQVVKILKKQKS